MLYDTNHSLIAMMKPLLAIHMAVLVSLGEALSYNNVAPHLQGNIAALASTAKAERRELERQRKSAPREVCERCKRPPVLCVCAALPDELIATATNVLVLQHPNEFRKKTFSTTPLLPLVLQNVQIRVGYKFEPETLIPVNEALARNQMPLLLFPGPNALSLDDTRAANSNSTAPLVEFNAEPNAERLLILIDGAWAEARRMAKASPRLLQACQQVQFTATSESIYDAVRKEPGKHCLSTLEACAQALVLLEPDSANAWAAGGHLEVALRSLIETKTHLQQALNVKYRILPL
jgi:DTW domain-containing protein YfiP